MERENKQENTLHHISHLHPLKLTINVERDRQDQPSCHACRLPCKDVSYYECRRCSYVLHVSCARLPNTLLHASHTSHSLTLHLLPPYPSGHFRCDACGEDSVAFCFHCSRCQFDLHLSCAALPERLNHPSHPQHLLSLVHGQPPCRGTGATVFCVVCRGIVQSSLWFYICEACNIGGHVGCFKAQTNKQTPSIIDDASAESLFSVQPQQQQMQNLALQSQMMQMRHESVMSIINNMNPYSTTPTYYTSYSYAPGFAGAMANAMMLESMAKAFKNGAGEGTGSSQEQQPQQPKEKPARSDRNSQFRQA